MLYDVCKKAIGSHSIHHQQHYHRMNASTAVWLMPCTILSFFRHVLKGKIPQCALGRGDSVAGYNELRGV